MAALQLFFALGFEIRSLVFDTFNFKLFAAAQTSTWLISSARVLILAHGTTRYVSSAYFTNEFPGCTDLRSAATTAYAAGPMPDPCIILAVIFAVDDYPPLNMVRWVCPSKKSTIQL